MKRIKNTSRIPFINPTIRNIQIKVSYRFFLGYSMSKKVIIQLKRYKDKIEVTLTFVCMDLKNLHMYSVK
jgi:hypothetical protein